MMNGLWIGKSGVGCGIERKRGLVWREKILDGVENMGEDVRVEGIIEGEESFLGMW